MKFSVNYVCEQTRRLELFRYSAVKPLLWDTSIQGLSPFWGHKIWSQENVHILFVSAAYVGGGIVFCACESFGVGRRRREILASPLILRTFL